MDYKIIWSPQGLETLGEVVAYIARNNPSAARKTGESILKKVLVLGRFPRIGKVFPELAREDVREIPVRPSRIIYHCPG